MTSKLILKGTAFLLLALLLLISCKKDVEDNTNLSPFANAGVDRIISQPQDSVHLDGSASADADGTIATFRWQEVAGPQQSVIVNANSSKTAVTGLVEGVYEFLLTVTDNLGKSARDIVQVTVNKDGSCSQETVKVVSGPGEMKEFGALSQPRSFVRSAVVADKMVFAGGVIDAYQNYTVSNTVDIYNFTTKAWSTAQLSKYDIYQHVTVGNKILFVSYGSEIDLYDAATGTWSVLTPSPVTGRYLPGIVVLGSKVFFAGGFVHDAPTAEVNIYDAAANTWSKAQLSEARAGITTAVVGNKLVFAGGHKAMDWDGNFLEPSKKVDIYDGATNTWSQADLPQPVYFGSVAVVGNKAVFSFESMDNVTIYDVATNQLSTVSLSLARLGTKAMSAGNKILVTGGYLLNGAYSSRVDIYDVSTGSWSVANMSRPGYVYWFAEVGNKLLLSVWNSDDYVNGSVFDVYDAGSSTFAAVQLSHQLFATPVVADGKLYFGGATVRTFGSQIERPACNVWELSLK